MTIPRIDWPRALARQSNATLKAVLDEHGAGWRIEPVQLPQAGLAMLQLKDGAFHDPYFIGEIPLASAWVEITLANGERCQGAVQLLDDDREKAELLAICDAVLAHDLLGCSALQKLLDAGMAEIAAEQALRSAMLHKTRVDFALLNAAEEDDDD